MCNIKYIKQVCVSKTKTDRETPHGDCMTAMVLSGWRGGRGGRWCKSRDWLSCRRTSASSSEGISEFVLSRIRNVLSSRLPSKNAVMYLKMTLCYAQLDFPCSLTYSNTTWWRNSPRSAMLTFSRKGSATGSCNKENNTVCAKYYTGIPFKASRCSHFSHTHTH